MKLRLLGLLLASTSFAAAGCADSEPTVEEALPDFEGYFRGPDGAVIELDGDVAVIRAMDNEADSLLSVGDVYLRNLTPTGENTWSGEALFIDGSTRVYRPVTVRLDGESLRIVGGGLTFVWTSDSEPSKPDAAVDSGRTADGSTPDAGRDAASAPVDAGRGPLQLTLDPILVHQTEIIATGTTKGGPEFRECGVVWATTRNPTTSNGKWHVNKENQGMFSTGGSVDATCTKYYARTFVTDVNGLTTYSAEQQFKSGPIYPFDCSLLNGVWGSSVATTGVTYTGRATDFTFRTIPESTSYSSWDNARDKGLVSIGSLFLNDIKPNGDDYHWTCQALWKSGTSSAGVTKVEFHPCTISTSDEGKTLNVSSTSPDEGTQTATLYRQ